MLFTYRNIIFVLCCFALLQSPLFAAEEQKINFLTLADIHFDPFID